MYLPLFNSINSSSSEIRRTFFFNYFSGHSDVVAFLKSNDIHCIIPTQIYKQKEKRFYFINSVLHSENSDKLDFKFCNVMYDIIGRWNKIEKNA